MAAKNRHCSQKEGKPPEPSRWLGEVEVVAHRLEQQRKALGKLPLAPGLPGKAVPVLMKVGLGDLRCVVGVRP